MARSPVVVRPPTEEDLTDLLALWEELRQRTGRGVAVAPIPSEDLLRERLADALGSSTFRGVVAEVDGQLAGMATFEVRPLGPLVDTPVVQVDYLHVREGFRRRGVGRALMASASSFAEDAGAEHLTVNVLPQLRDANRFYARLGFTPLVVRRVASVATLRRRLGSEPTPAAERAGRLARRRIVLRARATRAEAHVL